MGAFIDARSDDMSVYISEQDICARKMNQERDG